MFKSSAFLITSLRKRRQLINFMGSFRILDIVHSVLIRICRRVVRTMALDPHVGTVVNHHADSQDNKAINRDLSETVRAISPGKFLATRCGISLLYFVKGERVPPLRRNSLRDRSPLFEERCSQCVIHNYIKTTMTFMHMKKMSPI